MLLEVHAWSVEFKIRRQVIDEYPKAGWSDIAVVAEAIAELYVALIGSYPATDIYLAAVLIPMMLQGCRIVRIITAAGGDVDE